MLYGDILQNNVGTILPPNDRITYHAGTMLQVKSAGGLGIAFGENCYADIEGIWSFEVAPNWGSKTEYRFGKNCLPNGCRHVSIWLVYMDDYNDISICSFHPEAFSNTEFNNPDIYTEFVVDVDASLMEGPDGNILDETLRQRLIDDPAFANCKNHFIGLRY